MLEFMLKVWVTKLKKQDHKIKIFERIRMKAVTVVESGVQIIEVDIPSPKDSEVLVKVHAWWLNRAHLVVADGGAHGAAGGPGTIVGMEFSGEIIKCGEHVKNLSIGDRVMCSGAAVWAEYAIAD